MGLFGNRLARAANFFISPFSMHLLEAGEEDAHPLPCVRRFVEVFGEFRILARLEASSHWSITLQVDTRRFRSACTMITNLSPP